MPKSTLNEQTLKQIQDDLKAGETKLIQAEAQREMLSKELSTLLDWFEEMGFVMDESLEDQIESYIDDVMDSAGKLLEEMRGEA